MRFDTLPAPAPSRCIFSRRNTSISALTAARKAGVERLAGIDLLAIDQQRVGTRQARAVLIVIPEQLQVAVDEVVLLVLVIALEAGDPLVH